MVVSSSAQLNSLPVVAGVSISPSSATESTPLSASYTSTSDADAGQIVSVSWQWNLGGTPITGATTASLTGTDFDSGDSITVTATPNDTLEDGLPVTSAPVVIDNTSPSMTSVDITPTTAYTDTTLTANPAGWSDPDADTPSYLYEWFAGANPVGSDLATLAGSEFVKGDLVTVQLTPNDASSSGSSVLSNPGVTILNTLPTAPAVSISPATPDDSQDLVCSVSSPSSDVDPGDNVTYGYSWQESSNGSGTGATLPSSATAAGETWTCEVTPNDGEDDGPPGSASVGVVNAADCWSLEFDGVADHIYPSDSVALSFGSVTVGAWFKTNTSGAMTILQKKSGSQGGHHAYGLWVGGWGSSDSLCTRLETSGHSMMDLCSSVSVVDSDWHHGAVTYDQATGHGALYLDGALVNSATTGSGLYYHPNNEPFAVGTSFFNGAVQSPFNGNIGPVSVYTRALDPPEIVSLMAGSLGSSGAGVLYLMDEAAGTTVYDSSGNANHGSVSGATWVADCPPQ
jgi:hypothetical protein